MKKHTRRLRVIQIIAALLIIAIIAASMDWSDSFCNMNSAEKCPEECTICPPCEECSSISCHSPKFCESIGFDEKWYDRTKP